MGIMWAGVAMSFVIRVSDLDSDSGFIRFGFHLIWSLPAVLEIDENGHIFDSYDRQVMEVEGLLVSEWIS